MGLVLISADAINFRQRVIKSHHKLCHKNKGNFRQIEDAKLILKSYGLMVAYIFRSLCRRKVLQNELP